MAYRRSRRVRAARRVLRRRPNPDRADSGRNDAPGHRNRNRHSDDHAVTEPNAFDPAQLTVKVGTTVTWKVVGQSTHDLAARDGSFVNNTMSFGQTFSFTFAKAGRYAYVCTQHEGDGMTGEVTVIE